MNLFSLRRLCGALLIAASALLLLSACGEKKQVLRIYIWGDYISPEVVQQFESENNCRVELTEFDSNESMYAKLKAGAGGYDILVPSTYMASVMYEQGMLEKLDHRKLPNVDKYYDKSYKTLALDPEMEFSVPYFVSLTGIGYNTELIPDFKPTWRMFEKESIKGSCTLLNDHREVIGTALATLGYNVNTRDQKQIDEAVILAKKWKKNIAKFAVDDAKMDLASGAFKMIQTYNGDLLQLTLENPKLRFVIPEEGSTGTFDNWAIMKGSANVELAHKFIDFMYRTDVAVKNMNEIMYLTPHTEAVLLVNDELKNNPAFSFPPEARAKCTVLRDLDVDNGKYIRAWDHIREE